MTRVEINGGSLSKQKLFNTTSVKPGLDIFYTPQGNTPLCNHACNGCYYFANYKAGEEAIPSSDVPDLISKFKTDGYQNFYLTSSEALLAPNWEEILKASGDQYVNTNGKIIASMGDKILDRLSTANVKQIIITANITDSHQTLNLTPKDTVDKAFTNIKDYNNKNPDHSFRTVACAIITSENYNKVDVMCNYAHDVYKANCIKFMASITLPSDTLPGVSKLVPSKNELAISIAQIEKMRGKFNPDDFYIQRDGTLGSQDLKAKKIQHLCPAGDAIHSVKSLKDGAIVTPCIFLPQVEIGKIEKNKIIIDNTKLNKFLGIKKQAFDAGYCPGYFINTIDKVSLSFVSPNVNELT